MSSPPSNAVTAAYWMGALVDVYVSLAAAAIENDDLVARLRPHHTRQVVRLRPAQYDRVAIDWSFAEVPLCHVWGRSE